jgi:hypothetical protein
MLLTARRHLSASRDSGRFSLFAENEHISLQSSLKKDRLMAIVKYGEPDPMWWLSPHLEPVFVAQLVLCPPVLMIARLRLERIDSDRRERFMIAFSNRIEE